MPREDLIFVGACDIAGQVRGKGFPAADLDSRLRKGVGWTHSNMMQTAFGAILDTPFGTGGDLTIVPDPACEVVVDFGDGSVDEHFFLGDIRNTDGTAWECCPREFLRRAVAGLEAARGLNLIAAFEHEFVYTGVEDAPGHAYSLGAFRRQGAFGESFLGALTDAGVTPDSFLPEYGSRQYEVTVTPQNPVTAADQAVIVRELARATAHRLGFRTIFSPMIAPDGVGNGVHIHFSFRDRDGAPATHDRSGRLGLSAVAEHFCAGVLRHLPAICAITAPSPVSYLRLTPNRWAPTRIDIAAQDRGLALRVCPVFVAADAADADRQFNIEFRVADAAASPHMALGALIRAGTDGIEQALRLPEGGVAETLPTTLADALTAMEASASVRDWFGPVFLDAYLRHKRSEVAYVSEWSPAEMCARYGAVY